MVQDTHISAVRAPTASQQSYMYTAPDAQKALGSASVHGAPAAPASGSTPMLGLHAGSAAPAKTAAPTKVRPTGFE